MLKQLRVRLYLRPMSWLWYEYLGRLGPGSGLLYMNYGFAELDPAAPPLPLEPEDKADRFAIQLYHHTASAVPLVGLDVLEVGCGRGGGASYVARYLGPRSVVGLDRTRAAIRFCNRHLQAENLLFRVGNAESLPFPDVSFNAVLNVESSHGYGSMERFLAEVMRVLRPGGVLLLADFRTRNGNDRLWRQFEQAGFIIERSQRITPNVFRALELGNERTRTFIHRRLPRLLQRPARAWAATASSPPWEKFRQGYWEYYSYVLRKPA